MTLTTTPLQPCSHFMEMRHVDRHVSLHILLADMVSTAWTVISVCKHGICRGDCYVTIYILVADMISVMWIATSICRRPAIKVVETICLRLRECDRESDTIFHVVLAILFPAIYIQTNKDFRISETHIRSTMFRLCS